MTLPTSSRAAHQHRSSNSYQSSHSQEPSSSHQPRAHEQQQSDAQSFAPSGRASFQLSSQLRAPSPAWIAAGSRSASHHEPTPLYPSEVVVEQPLPEPSLLERRNTDPFNDATKNTKATLTRNNAANDTNDLRQELDWGSSSLGAEPGLDPSKATLSLSGNVSVKVVDWSVDRVVVREFDGPEYVAWFAANELREPWVKTRWINIDGLNWDVIKATALRFDLHPLALEDAVKYRSHSISKADWFSDQLFVRVLVHSLCPAPQDSHASAHNRSGFVQKCLESFGLDRSNRHARDVLAGDTEQAGTFGFGVGRDDDEEGDSDDEGQETADQDAKLAGGRRWTWADDEDEKGVEDVKLEEQLAAKAVVKSLTSSFRVAIDKQQMSSFLLPTDSKHGGTLISIFTDSGAGLTDSIIQRIRTSGTLLRTTEDPSMLLQALLDVVVDDVLEVVEEFRRELDVLEGRALVNPDIKAVRHLHVLSGQLLMLKRTLSPLQTMLLSLRFHDTERTKVSRHLSTNVSQTNSIYEGHDALGSEGSPMETRPSAKGLDAHGFLSPVAKLYLADVNDHIDSVLSSLELFSNLATGVVDFIFNSLSFSSNVSAKWLTIVSTIFLPLSFLTGYFGMNFLIMPEMGIFPEGTEPYGPNQDSNVSYFYKISIPIVVISAIVIIIGEFGSIFVGWFRRLTHKVERKKHRRVIRTLRKKDTGLRRRKP